MPQEITIQDVERLVDKFKIERIFYLITIAVCTLIIVISAIFLIFKGNWQTGISLLAPGGTIFLCLSRVFKMWDDIMKAFFNLKPEQ